MQNPFELASKRVAQAVIAYLTPRKAAMWQGLRKIRFFAGIGLYWPFMILLGYWTASTIALLVWYAFARLLGIWVPSGSVFQAVQSYERHPIILFGAMFIIAFWVFMIRTHARALYGFVEMVVGAVIASSINLSDADQKREFLTVAGGLYVMVRGLDNIDKALPSKHILSQLLHLYPKFIRYWMISDRTITIDQAADPTFWELVADKDPLAEAPDEPGVRKID